MHTTDQLNTALAGRYAIDRLIGEGGMATVYLARDVKHHRNVALKVLKPELGAVLGVERFLSEIRVTANLQHPNLLPLFDSGEAGGLLFYVMPYVEGESLRAKLEREKQLPIDEAVRIALAIAAALDYAHRHGVIHRDLKPENILLHDGQPVIADFGIALAVSNAGGARVTQTGLSLGTPQYMSPEQAAGDRVIDGRSDIYSLAALTYEMIAAEPPHSGTTAQAIIAKLMTAEPKPLSELRNSAPVHVEIAVQRALAKLPADRYSTAREFADALEGKGFTLLQHTVEHRTGRRSAAAPVSSIARHPVVLGLAAALLLMLGLSASRWARDRGAESPATVRFEMELPSSINPGGAALGTNLAVSPDGRTIAFAAPTGNGRTSIYVRAVNEVESRVLAGTEDGTQPVFSPDGLWIAFFAVGGYRKVPVAGGTSVQLAGVGAFPIGAAWSRRGLIVTSVANNLMVMPTGGGPARLLAAPDTSAGDAYFTTPQVLEDGETVIFSAQPLGGNSGRIKLAAISIDGGPITRLEVSGIAPLGVLEGNLIYVDVAGALFAVPFDPSALKTRGEPVALGLNAVVRAGVVAEAALSRAGTLLVQSGTIEGQLGEVDFTGRFTPILAESKPYGYPRFSPDGRRLVLSIGIASRSDVWVHDLASATSTRITTEGTLNERPEWTHDGKRVLFRTDRRSRSAIWSQSADESGAAVPLLDSPVNDYYEAVVSPDGRYIVYQQDDAGSEQANVMFRAFAGDTMPKAIANSHFIEAQGRVSPDGKWVAFITDASGVSQVVVQPFPGPGPRVQVSASGGAEPVWARGGGRLFYRDGSRFVAVSYSTSPSFVVTGRTPLFSDDYVYAESPHANYDVHPDGKRFVVIRNTDAAKVVVAYGWRQELRARLGAPR